MKRRKRQAPDCEKILAKHIPNRGLVSGVDKEGSKLSSKQTNNPKRTHARQVFSVLSIISHQGNAHVSHGAMCCTPSRTARFQKVKEKKKKTDDKLSEDMEELELSFIAGGIWCNHSGKHFSSFYKAKHTFAV